MHCMGLALGAHLTALSCMLLSCGAMPSGDAVRPSSAVWLMDRAEGVLAYRACDMRSLQRLQHVRAAQACFARNKRKRQGRGPCHGVSANGLSTC
jgi:hypothetical protein